MNQRHLCFLFLAVTILLGWTALHPSILESQGQGPMAASKFEEYLVMGDPARGSGEPQIAVNPTNSKNIVITGMASLHRLGDVLPAPRGARAGRGDTPVPNAD